MCALTLWSAHSDVASAFAHSLSRFCLNSYDCINVHVTSVRVSCSAFRFMLVEVKQLAS